MVGCRMPWRDARARCRLVRSAAIVPRAPVASVLPRVSREVRHVEASRVVRAIMATASGVFARDSINRVAR